MVRKDCLSEHVEGSCVIMNATLSGKPDAGNPRSRLVEVNVASAKPRRGALLFKSCPLLAFVLFANACFAQKLVVYPEYPSDITRDYAYQVSVVQGDESRRLTVYNHCEKSALFVRTRGGDVNRRFCEFAFSGAPVRVDVRVVEDVASYKVFPARLGLRSEFRDGVISVWLERPVCFGLQLNDYDKTILSVFADKPEDPSLVPGRNKPGVMFIEGWKDALSADGVIETDASIREIYLAPGSVLNARLRVRGKGTRIHGRGMILDPFSDVFRAKQTKNTRRGLVSLTEKCTIEDVKLIDARTFNICAWGDDVTIRNVKELASMMCSDGFTNGGKRLLAEDCWLYVGDNALVVSGVKDSVYRNIVLGTSCAAIFPQGSNSNVTLEAISVFRADDGLVNNFHNGVLRRNNKWSEMNSSLQKKEPGPQDLKHQYQDFRFVDLSAVDCTLFSHFFSGRNMGSLPKTFVFDGLALPFSTGRSDFRSIGQRGGQTLVIRNDPKKWLNTDNYSFTFTDLWVGGERARFGEKEIVGGDKARIEYAETERSHGFAVKDSRRIVGWTCPYKVYRGKTLVRDWRLVDMKTGERRLEVAETGANLVEETLPRQSVWQRTPSWLVKLETTGGTNAVERVYELIQCEKGAGMQAIVTEGVLSRGLGRYALTFEVRAQSESVREGRRAGLMCRVASNDWNTECRASAAGTWDCVKCEFDLAAAERQATKSAGACDLVTVYIGATEPTDKIEIRKARFSRIGE